MSTPQEQALELKNEGNEYLKQNNLDAAIDCYTRAIELDGQNHIFFSNRSAAYAKKNDFVNSLKDAQEAVSISPKYARGYSRIGLAQTNLGDFEGAMDSYSKGLELSPNDATMQAGFQQAQFGMQQKQSMAILDAFQGDVIAKVRKLPGIEYLADDKNFKEKIKDIQSNIATKINEYISDEQIQQYLIASMQAQDRATQQPSVSEEEAMERRRRREESRLRGEAKREDARRKAEKERKLKEEQRKKEEYLNSLSDIQKEALEIKEQANQLYKKKDFDGAMELYAQAAEIDPTNMVFKSNIASVLFSKKEYEKAIELSREALQIGYDNMAPLEHKANALKRIGLCYLRLEMYEEAIAEFDKAQLESRSADCLKYLKSAQKLLDEKKRREYEDPQLSEEARTRGNNFFREGKFPEAVKEYTESIKRNPTDKRPYSNRGTAYQKLGAFPQALKDLDKAIELDPTYILAYVKKGNIHYMMKEYNKALSTYDLALEHDPDNADITAGINKALLAINTESRDEETVRRNIENDPEIREILSDPMMQTVLQNLNDPVAAQKYLSDPTIAAKLRKLSAAGVIR
eukprot:TRINITY_DN12269_c0_g1_i1.p1 TRINITY_DN12269_c0_g1~~TRINITY_DN12269_c0_g1_i1.p1  ORF type:complete len:575 (+),score=183.54 TRINITY_DN12269_c0_g1_i1:27-1751(+)